MVKTKKQYGLIGHPLGHTLSPFIHKHIMKDCGITGVYKVYDIEPGQFDDRIGELLKKLDGFNVTIPYKESILSHLSGIDSNSKKFGAVNTVYGQHGYNTDFLGFKACGISFYQKRVLLLGAGGVSRVMLYEAVKAGAKEVVICARRECQAINLINEIKLNLDCGNVVFREKNQLSPIYDVILNATPIGMWPNCDGIPISKEIILGAEFIFDTIYNPLATKLVLAARSYGIAAQCGLSMLYFQAVEAQKIWNPGADFSNLSILIQQHKLKSKLLQLFPVKFVLTGFMGCGKTTVGKVLAKIMHVGFVDLDLCVIEEKKKPISEIFEKEGESAFRQAERLCLTQVLNEPRTLVIATGGGALIDPENVELVRKSQGFIFFLSVDLETILSRIGKTTDRPLLHGKAQEKIENLYVSRIPVYNKIADCVVDAEGSVEDIATRIKIITGF